MPSLRLLPPARRAGAAAAALALLLAACDGGVPLVERLEPATPHERYADALRDAGLAGTALGRGWLAAADSALTNPTAVPLPYREAGYFASDEARAVAYAVRLRSGQRLVVELAGGDSTALLFADLYEMPADTLGEPRRVAGGDSVGAPIEVVARREATYVLRLQPELLRAVRYELTLRATASLAVFPVAGRTSSAVRSGFGAARDGGRREHHGIDIFAPRGTPVVAATDGWIRSTTPNRLGGNVVWLRDARGGQSLYYAHLDTVLVQAGEQVRAGDTLGLVGNTGNARTTPPHLHFGIYARGPRDPLPYVHVPRERPAAVTAALAALGEDRRTRGRATLRTAPGGDGAPLPAGTPLRVIGAAAGAYRVVLPDGRDGWIAAGSTEPLAEPLGRTRLTAGAALRDRPAPAGVTIDTVAPGSTLPVLGRLGAYALVRRGARTGWVDVASD